MITHAGLRRLSEHLAPAVASGSTATVGPEEIAIILAAVETGHAALHVMEECEHKAWDSLARYKFFMFGYWAAFWVKLRPIVGWPAGNPWAWAVDRAKAKGFGYQPPARTAA